MTRAALVLALLIGGSRDTNATEAVVETRIMDLGGYCVRVRSAGLDARAPGTPLVIFESGIAQSSDAWRSILPRAGRFAPALSYDRAGLGESEWDRTDPTIEQMNLRLRRLLDQLGAEPPYLLVGHSLGGMLVHQFAARWPSEVVGLVLVDPAPLLTEGRSFGLLPFEKIGAGEKGFDLYWSAVSEMASKASPPVRGEFQMLRAALDAELEERAMLQLPPLPLVVIVAAKFQALPLYDSMPFDGREYFDAELRLRVGVLQDWVVSSPDGTLLVTNRVAHSIPRDAPELVLWAIERLVSDLLLPQP